MGYTRYKTRSRIPRSQKRRHRRSKRSVRRGRSRSKLRGGMWPFSSPVRAETPATATVQMVPTATRTPSAASRAEEGQGEKELIGVRNCDERQQAGQYIKLQPGTSLEDNKDAIVQALCESIRRQGIQKVYFRENSGLVFWNLPACT